MDHTTDTFFLGSWVSFYSFDKDPYTVQLDRIKEIGLNFNIFPMVFCSGVGGRTDHSPSFFGKTVDIYPGMWYDFPSNQKEVLL